MNFVFRVDASIEMGIGHVMRCLTLADALKHEGGQCYFVCREHPGNFIDQIARRGHQVFSLPLNQVANSVVDESAGKPPLAHDHWLGSDWFTDAQHTLSCIGSLSADWLVVDHYALDGRWEELLRPACNKIMVIDDLADRYHNCDVLLDQNFGRSNQDYLPLVPTTCSVLTGSKFVLMRAEFASLREYSLQRRSKSEFKHLLITMGGFDNDNVTGAVLQSLKVCPIPKSCRITVVMGGKAPWLGDVKAKTAELPWSTTVKVDVSNMARLMADSDLAIGAAGSTTWERCCLGLPTIMLVIADNQRIAARHLEQAGAVFLLNEDWRDDALQEIFRNLLAAELSMSAMVDCASRITDGTGLSAILPFLLDKNEK